MCDFVRTKLFVKTLIRVRKTWFQRACKYFKSFIYNGKCGAPKNKSM